MKKRSSLQDMLRDVFTPKVIAAALAVAVFAVCLTLLINLRLLPGQESAPDDPQALPDDTEEEPPEQPEGEYFIFGGEQVQVIDGLAVNEYDLDRFYYDDQGFLRYDDENALMGIDVSSHQREIDWEAVSASGVEFAMIRVGYRGHSKGTVNYDDYYRANIEGALAAGLEVGVYFFSQAVNEGEAIEEARFLLHGIEGYDVTFPVVFDWETITNDEARTDGLPGSVVTSCAAVFCRAVEKAGYSPAVYINRRQAYYTYDLETIMQYPIWLAEYSDLPTYYYDFQMWQHSNTGSVPGIEGDVDLNICFTPYCRLE